MKILLTLIGLVAIIWSIAWIGFLQNVPFSPSNNTQKTDAIVVFTGGSVRIQHGFSQLGEGLAPQLFISGVGADVNAQQLLETHSNQAVGTQINTNKSSIVLDHIARSTRTNALETAAFVGDKQIRSLRLVTANYHMPRSLLEMRHTMPDLTIIPDAVIPKGFGKNEWWKHANARHLLLLEFHKCWAVKLYHLLKSTDSYAA